MLKQLFSQCGTIIDCSLNGREEDPYRYGFIDFASEEDRLRAMKFNGFPLNDRKLKVGISKGNVNKPDGFSSMMGRRPEQGMMMPGMPAGISPAQMEMLVQMIQNAQNGGQPLPGAAPATTSPQPQAYMMNPPPNAMPSPSGGPYGAMPMPHPMSAGGPPQWAGMPPAMGPQGGYPMQMHNGGGGQHHMGGGNRMPYTRGPANAAPSEELMRLREKQRKDYFDVVRRDAEKYEKKMSERSNKDDARGGKDGQSSDDDSSDDEQTAKRERRESHTDGSDHPN